MASISVAYRVLALCALLREADSNRFTELLCKAGQARLNLLERATSGLQVSPRVMAASNDVGFLASLAAGDLPTARRIAALSPDTATPGWEDEEDFVFFHCLHQMVHPEPQGAGLRQVLTRWRQLEGDSPSPFFQVCESLLENEASRFHASFTQMLDARQVLMREYRKQLNFDRELYATEGKVYINGLALLRLAESRGLPGREHDVLIPRLALLSSFKPLPEHAWREL
ncbi:hypothetical protein ACN469_37860 [Corallococcus terminator]